MKIDLIPETYLKWSKRLKTGQNNKEEQDEVYLLRSHKGTENIGIVKTSYK